MLCLMRVSMVFILALWLDAAHAQLATPEHSPAQTTAEAAQQSTASGQVSADSAQAQARTELKQGKYADAITLLQQIAASHPKQKGVDHDLGLAYYRSSKLQEALDSFVRAIAADPSDLESVQMEGLTLFRMGQPAAAVPYLELVRQWAPNANADANYVLGLCYLNTQNFDGARGAFAAQYGVPADSGSAYLLLAQMLVTANLPEQAADAARKALQLSPGLPLAHFLLGEVALYKSDIDGATHEFEAERAINPAYAPVYDRLGDLYSRVGQFELAQQCLMKSISLDRSSTGPFILMGKVLLRRSDPQTAVLYLRHAEKMDPSNFITHNLLGQAYRSLGQEQEAKQEFDAAAKIHAAEDEKATIPQ
jgi:tetratricopeptide (TPR) repeat protein